MIISDHDDLLFPTACNSLLMHRTAKQLGNRVTMAFSAQSLPEEWRRAVDYPLDLSGGVASTVTEGFGLSCMTASLILNEHSRTVEVVYESMSVFEVVYESTNECLKSARNKFRTPTRSPARTKR